MKQSNTILLGALNSEIFDVAEPRVPDGLKNAIFFFRAVG